MTDLRRVRPREERTVEASADDPAALAVAFLQQLLLLWATEGFLVRTVRAAPVGRPPTAVLAVVRGEPFDPRRHRGGVEVKAVTMHRLRFDPEAGDARVIVDI